MAVFHTASWRLISGILGVTCFLLMATLGILLKNLFSEQSIEATVSPEFTTELQKVSCCFCPEKWIGFRCNCYLISNEEKTWAESRRTCASQNSSLLTLESWDELGFLKRSKIFYWLGLSYNAKYGAWLWEDGSAPSRDL
ncbi:natural killer cells antigen CD94-like [Tenrec ecaudatus]|uniref:natural killer cells antigen CD94-like n=1 Tax=Tenrec ecaudatus TaxID=94439 RepID=UPI003F59D657